MKDKLKKISLLILAAALAAAALASCSKDESPEPAVSEEQTEQTAAPDSGEGEPETTTAAKDDKKSEETTTTKKKKKTTTTTAATTKKGKKTKKTTTTAAVPVELPEITADDPVEIEKLIDEGTGFFSDRVADLLGQDKDTILSMLKYSEDYTVMNEPEKKDGETDETMSYVVDGDKKYALALEFVDGKLSVFSCNSPIADYKTVLSAANSKGWKKNKSVDDEMVRNEFTLTGKNVVYKLYKYKDDGTGRTYAAQSYELSE